MNIVEGEIKSELFNERMNRPGTGEKDDRCTGGNREVIKPKEIER